MTRLAVDLPEEAAAALAAVEAMTGFSRADAVRGALLLYHDVVLAAQSGGDTVECDVFPWGRVRLAVAPLTPPPA